MRYESIGKELFVLNRKRPVKELPPHSLVVVNANDAMPTNSDGATRFRQNSDLGYLTGVDQEETPLVLAPDFPDKKYREVLFIRETSEEIAIWEGQKLTKEQATEVTGISQVLWTSEFPRLFNTLMVAGDLEQVFLNTNEHYRAAVDVETRDMRFIK